MRIKSVGFETMGDFLIAKVELLKSGDRECIVISTTNDREATSDNIHAKRQYVTLWLSRDEIVSLMRLITPKSEDDPSPAFVSGI